MGVADGVVGTADGLLFGALAMEGSNVGMAVEGTCEARLSSA